ncbi:unnamed protein product [Pedinophyceae sp. YPF-701]|nr:unnamed protein product [Pedinophyceae sp. YPF-701]
MAALAVEHSCTMLVHFDRPMSVNELKTALESDDTTARIEALRRVIAMMLNGEQLPQLFITIVRYLLPSDNHQIQKLLLLYMETIKRTDASGKLLPEMILVCQNLRNNLQHPNEYVRGVTLRFLCRIHEEEILEPLVPSVIANLEHRHSYVRRNAVLALDSIAKLPKGDLLLPDIGEVIASFLSQEQDPGARRNALALLTNHDMPRATDALLEAGEGLATWPESLQVAALETVRRAVRSDAAWKGRLIPLILAMMQAPSPGALYEAAGTLLQLSHAPTAVRASVQCYCQLLLSQSDNNVKLILLDRLHELLGKHRDIVREALMDLLRSLASPNLDVRAKVLGLAMELVTQRNVDEVFAVLKKEIARSQTRGEEGSAEYRTMLVQAIHKCAVRFPEVTGSVVQMLMDFLGDSSTTSALEVAHFMREVAATNAGLRGSIFDALLATLGQIQSGRVATAALWMAGEFCDGPDAAVRALDAIDDAVGPTPIAAESEEDAAAPGAPGGRRAQPATRTVVLPDGSYATQTVLPDVGGGAAQAPPRHNLRAMLLAGEYFVGAVVASTCAKLILRLRDARPGPETNRRAAATIRMLAAVVRLGRDEGAAHPIDTDSASAVMGAIAALSTSDPKTSALYLETGRRALDTMLAEKLQRDEQEMRQAARAKASEPDDAIEFTQLRARAAQLPSEDSDATVDWAAPAPKAAPRTVQLTGLSDPVYAEAQVTVHQYDVVLDVAVTNRTRQVMQNVTLELATLGDLKLVERPQQHTLAPDERKHIRANIKVSSTETGVIFGNIVYEAKGYGERTVVVLNDIHIDIMDYITPATCPDVAFRNMWAEFEWENKVVINTSIRDARQFIEHVVASTNMRCLTPASALEGDCTFLAANLYARSVFGEDALINVSVEQQPHDGKLGGSIRIRSKTQGMALSLGDKITLQQART